MNTAPSLRDLQLKILEILDIVIRICEDYHIQYSLCGGTVVGAHLYKGFLPWDDDVDLMMTRENYNRFLEVAPSCLPEGYSLVNYQMEDALSTRLMMNFSKVMDNRTTYVHNEGYIMGVFVDITVYDRVPKGMLRYVDLFLYRWVMSVNRGHLTGRSLKNMFRNFLLDHVLPERIRFLRFYQRVVERLSHTQRYTYRELFGAYYYKNLIAYRPSVFEHYTTIDFEGRQCMIVRDYVEYLQTRYDCTDFHEPPLKQVPLHYVYFDPIIPYKDYVNAKHTS
jgi:lipopolysaccharide cholinephosphotransferase